MRKKRFKTTRNLSIDFLEPRLVLSHSPIDHIHAVLEIELEGESLEIPANIGLSSSGHFNPHTHDGTGELHIGEGGPAGLGNTIRYLNLDDFFDVWREAGGVAGNNRDSMFNAGQIMDRVADSQSEVLMLVNGTRNTEYERYVPHDGDLIQIQFNRRSWHNSELSTDVNGRDGTTPLDALIVIRELSVREYSDPTNGKLNSVPKKFLDVDNDTFLGPVDALLVIGNLPSGGNASAVVTPDPTGATLSLPEYTDDSLDETADAPGVYDLIFAQTGGADI